MALLALFAIVVAAMPAGLRAQSFPDPGSLKDFSDAMIETPNTAMIIRPSDPVTTGDTNTVGNPDPGASTVPPGGVPFDIPMPNVEAGNYEGPVGVSGIFNGNIQTGCSYDPLSHSAHRQIDDIAPLAGSVGKYPLKMTRYYNSRSQEGSGWSHEYSWGMSRLGTRVFYPNGNVQDGLCGPVEGVSDYWEVSPGQDGNGTWRLADGGKVVFESHRPVQIIDPYGQTTTVAYATDNTWMTVTEPGGRYLKFNYITDQWHNHLLDNVEAYDGPQNNRIERVRYTYHWQQTGGPPGGITQVMMLTDVAYDDGTTAHYTYTTDNVPNDSFYGIFKTTPLLATAADTRYHGPMRQIAYEYDGGPHGTIHSEKYSDNGPAVTAIASPIPLYLAVGSYSMPVEFTETRGDQQPRKFHYTPLQYRRCAPGDNCTPCDATSDNIPQHQMLQWYTDFQGHRTSLGYDPISWYVTSVTDANGNTTYYGRGDIGEVTSITHPAGYTGNNVYYRSLQFTTTTTILIRTT
jgi:hypothetical protein